MSRSRVLCSATFACALLTVGGTAIAQRVPTAQAYQFNPVRIVAGGYIPGLIGHPKQAGLIYMRTDIGGVYRWNPSTSQWIPLLDFMAPANYNLTGPESIAIDPNDPSRLYIAAGMYSGGPYAFLVSTNQGTTFTTYSIPSSGAGSFVMASNNNGRSVGERLAVNPFKSNELFMGTRSNGLWVSENYAQSWTQVASYPVKSDTNGYGVQWVAFDPKNPGYVYTGDYTNSTVYLSTDDGATWNPVAGQPTSWPFTVSNGTHAPAPERGVFGSDGNLYMTFADLPGPNSMDYGLVERYNPSTKVWTNITPPFDTAEGQSGPLGGFCGLTIDPNTPGTVAVSTFDRWYPVDTVYLSRDGGSTWSNLGLLVSNSGVDGPQAGNYYFGPSVYSPISPYLTFGDTSYPISPTPSSKFGWWISALLIDPTNPNHLMYGTGATLYATDNLSAADSGTASTWYVQGEGIEETAVIALISPSQGAHLLSGVGDIGGFRHDDFTVSPAGGMYTNPVATTVGSLDWAGQNPSLIVRTQSPASASTSPCTYGAWSTDGGTTWNPFPKCATGGNSSNGGVASIDAGGTMIMWSPASGNSNRAQYSTNDGTSWTSSTGLPARITVVADKVTPTTFYAFYSSTGSTGGFYSTTTSGGTAFTKVNTASLGTTGSCNGSGCGIPVVNFAKAGDIWLPLGTNGLYHSTNGGVTWTKLANVSAANSMGIGAPAPGTSSQSILLYGTTSPLGVLGLYRSDNNGASWLRINDDLHQYGGPTLITADPRIYGRVYFGMNGRGIIYGDIAQ
ncbi:MAG TPA: hypothetical protein VMB03_04000 [Bryobacteraceae bacterium]|nr:hypothetical protein [Bryobacteraceae bacterium]